MPYLANTLDYKANHPCCCMTWDSPACSRAEVFKPNPAGQLNCLPASKNQKVDHSHDTIVDHCDIPTYETPQESECFVNTGDTVGPKQRFKVSLTTYQSGKVIRSKVTSWKLSTWYTCTEANVNFFRSTIWSHWDVTVEVVGSLAPSVENMKDTCSESNPTGQIITRN